MANYLSTLVPLSDALADLVAAAAPRVVSVAARSPRPSTGIALGGDLIITADHAVERERGIVITVGEERYEASLAGRDPATDVAVLRAPGLDVPPPELAPPPRTGSLVISLSRTGSGTLSAGLGVITSVGGPLRTGRGAVLPTIIRTDAALRPGTAGGALLNAAGEIVGMTTPGLLRGLPVAIPAAEAAQIAQRLASQQPLGRGYLGLSVHGATLTERQRDAAADGRGLLVLGVAPEGAADRAGILVGDVLLRFEGRALGRPDDLQDSLIGLAPGAVVTITLLRGAAAQEVAMTVGERPAE